MRHVWGGWTFSQNFSSLALTVCDLWYYEDLEEKGYWINELISNKAVYRTVLATLGLFIMTKYESWVNMNIGWTSFMENMNYGWIWIMWKHESVEWMVEYQLWVNIYYGWIWITVEFWGGPGFFWGRGGGGKDICMHTDRHTHQYHDSAWPRSRAEWKCTPLLKGCWKPYSKYIV